MLSLLKGFGVAWFVFANVGLVFFAVGWCATENVHWFSQLQKHETKALIVSLYVFASAFCTVVAFAPSED